MLTGRAPKHRFGASGLVTPGGYVLPKNSPPGLLNFLVGIQANESGFDYYRAQGSPPGSIQDPSTSVGGGYGAYQFQVGTDQYNAANQAGWDPKTQDKIAADMATGYYHNYLGLAQQNGVDVWQYVAEAWYGPGTVPQNPIAPNSIADVQNVLASEAGKPNLPNSWVYGPGYRGLSSQAISQEIGGKPASSSGTGGGGLFSGAPSGSTGGGGGLFSGGVSPFPTFGPSWAPWNWGSDAGNAVATEIVHVVVPLAFILLGVILVAYGLKITFDDSGTTVQLPGVSEGGSSSSGSSDDAELGEVAA